jgi:hypothetical protein
MTPPQIVPQVAGCGKGRAIMDFSYAPAMPYCRESQALERVQEKWKPVFRPDAR